MPVIKRYPNRKLYDTEAKQYITLEGIAALIRQGNDVQVVDYTSGEDLTALTLTQIIVEQEKKKSGFLPQSVLTGLVQSGGDTLATLRQSLASPLDLAHQVDEEIERRVQALTRRGELAAEEGRRLRDNLMAQRHGPDDASRPTDQEIEQVLVERGVPTRDDFQQVLAQLEALAEKLERASADDEAG